MADYMRRTPSRLRTTCPQFKNNPAQAEAVEASLRQMHGVLSVKASTATGNLFIHYDSSCIRPDDLLKSVHQAQRKSRPAPVSGQPRPAPVPHRSFAAPASRVSEAATSKLGEMLVGMLVEKCIERSTIALVAALL